MTPFTSTRKLRFTEKQIHIDSLVRNFRFEVAYTTSDTDTYAWLNCNEGCSYAILGYNRNNHGYTCYITVEQAEELIKNLN